MFCKALFIFSCASQSIVIIRPAPCRTSQSYPRRGIGELRGNWGYSCFFEIDICPLGTWLPSAPYQTPACSHNDKGPPLGTGPQSCLREGRVFRTSHVAAWRLCLFFLKWAAAYNTENQWGTLRRGEHCIKAKSLEVCASYLLNNKWWGGGGSLWCR